MSQSSQRTKDQSYYQNDDDAASDSSRSIAAVASTNPRKRSASMATGMDSTVGAAVSGEVSAPCNKRHNSGSGSFISSSASSSGGGSGSSKRKVEFDRFMAEKGIHSGSVSINQTYPVRVELAEWCIDYGQEASNIPFIWLISRWDVYYRLEKPAGRYIPTFLTAKMKFEVSTRVIKTLQYNPSTEFRPLVELLTAATREESRLRRLKKKAQLKEKRRCAKEQQMTVHQQQGGSNFNKIDILKLESDDNINDYQNRLTGSSNSSNSGRNTNDRHQSSSIDSSTFPFNIGVSYDSMTTNYQLAANINSNNHAESLNSSHNYKKKNRNWRIYSLSSPQGTGVAINDANGRPQALTPWGAPYAVEGFKESMLLGLAEFLESQLRNFMEGVVGANPDGMLCCPNLLNSPFIRTLREKTALRMETMQLVEAKRRALDVARNLVEASAAYRHHHPHHHHHHNLHHHHQQQQQQQSVNLAVDPAAVLLNSAHVAASFQPYNNNSSSSDQSGYFHRNLLQSSAYQQQHYNAAAYNNSPLDVVAAGSADRSSSLLNGFLNGGSSTGAYFQPNGILISTPHHSGPVEFTSEAIQALEQEIQHLQNLLKDDDEEEENDEDEDDDSDGADEDEQQIHQNGRRSDESKNGEIIVGQLLLLISGGCNDYV